MQTPGGHPVASQQQCLGLIQMQLGNFLAQVRFLLQFLRLLVFAGFVGLFGVVIRSLFVGQFDRPCSPLERLQSVLFDRIDHLPVLSAAVPTASKLLIGDGTPMLSRQDLISCGG